MEVLVGRELLTLPFVPVDIAKLVLTPPYFIFLLLLDYWKAKETLVFVVITVINVCLSSKPLGSLLAIIQINQYRTVPRFGFDDGRSIYGVA